jgi:O-antigen ligase
LLYASRIQASVPEAYEQLVRGAYQWLVVLQFSLIGLLFTGSYVLLRMNVSRRVRWTDAVFVVSAIFLVVSVGHTAIRRTWLYVLVLLMSWALWQRGTSETDQLPGGSVRRPVMIGLGAVALLTYLTMGTIRETARRPDTVRNLISLQDEVRNPAALRGTPENNMDLRTQQME